MLPVPAALLLCASCASTNLPALGSRPALLRLEKDEEQVWRDGEQLERMIEKSGFLHEGPELEAYLSGIARALVASRLEGLELSPRVRVVRDPFLNAFALPHGAIYVHSGLLARIDNEAQLAAVLGHELTHFTHRHAVREMRSARNKLAWGRTLQLLTLGAGVALWGEQMGSMLGDIGGSLAALWALTSFYGYSRELETEADEHGLDWMLQAGYDPNEAPKVFEHLQAEVGEAKVEEPFVFATHPRLQERIDNARSLLQTRYSAQASESGRQTEADAYLDRIGDLLLSNAALDLRIGRLEVARAAVERHLEWRPDSPRGHFLLGEVRRRSGQTGEAIAAYRKAAESDTTFAEPHRELGLLYRAEGRLQEARAAFEQYLALSPDAVDAPIIRGYVSKIEESGKDGEPR